MRSEDRQAHLLTSTHTVDRRSGGVRSFPDRRRCGASANVSSRNSVPSSSSPITAKMARVAHVPIKSNEPFRSLRDFAGDIQRIHRAACAASHVSSPNAAFSFQSLQRLKSTPENRGKRPHSAPAQAAAHRWPHRERKPRLAPGGAGHAALAKAAAGNHACGWHRRPAAQGH